MLDALTRRDAPKDGMPTHVVLLRGVNNLGGKKVAMADQRTAPRARQDWRTDLGRSGRNGAQLGNGQQAGQAVRTLILVIRLYVCAARSRAAARPQPAGHGFGAGPELELLSATRAKAGVIYGLG